MKSIDTIEEAVVGRTINLSVIECLVIANLTNALTGSMKEDRKQQYVNTSDLIKMRALMMKLTGQDIISLEDAEKELFAPVEEELRYNDEGEVVTSTVEAFDGNGTGVKRVGKIDLRQRGKDDDDDNIETILEHS